MSTNLLWVLLVSHSEKVMFNSRVLVHTIGRVIHHSDVKVLSGLQV